MDLLSIIPYEVAVGLVPGGDTGRLTFAVPIVVALPLLILAWRADRTLRRVRGAAATPIGQARPGEVALTGTAEVVGDSPLEAPLTGEACVWYRYAIEAYGRPDTSSDNCWYEVAEAASGVPILLRDDTGTVRILPDTAEIVPAERRVWEGPSRTPPGRPRMPEYRPIAAPVAHVMADLVRSHIRDPEGEHRYTEEWIAPGERLYVCGELTAGGTAQPPLRLAEHAALAEEAARRAPQAIVPTERQPLLLLARSPDPYLSRSRRIRALCLCGVLMLLMAAAYLALAHEVFIETIMRG